MRITNLENRVTNIENQLPNFLRKVTPIPGYNPLYISGGVAANVRMYNITPIDDNNIRFYYIQFNDIWGSPGFQSDIAPLPRTLGHFNWVLPYPFAVSGLGNTYQLIIEVYAGFRLKLVSGSRPEGRDYIGFLLVGNASSAGPNEEDIESMPVEDLCKMVRKLQFEVNQLNNKQTTETEKECSDKK
jgi:hypothetical protein